MALALDNDEVDEDLKEVWLMFDEGMDLYTAIVTGDSESETECRLVEAICILENVTKQLSEKRLFSTYRTLLEVPTSCLRFLLTPALLGLLTLKFWHRDREELLAAARVYLGDFLGRVRGFGLLDPCPPGLPCDPEGVPGPAGLVVETQVTRSGTEQLKMTVTPTARQKRDAKLERHSQLLAMQRSADRLRASVQRLEDVLKDRTDLDRKAVEKQMRRAYHITQIRWFANRVIEELELMDCEKRVLAYMRHLKLGPTFFEKELEKKLPFNPQARLSKPVLMSDGLFQQQDASLDKNDRRNLFHTVFNDFIFKDPMIPFPPTPAPSVHTLVAEEVAPVVEEEPTPATKEDEGESEQLPEETGKKRKESRDKIKGKKKQSKEII